MRATHKQYLLAMSRLRRSPSAMYSKTIRGGATKSPDDSSQKPRKETMLGWWRVFIRLISLKKASRSSELSLWRVFTATGTLQLPHISNYVIYMYVLYTMGEGDIFISTHKIKTVITHKCTQMLTCTYCEWYLHKQS